MRSGAFQPLSPQQIWEAAGWSGQLGYAYKDHGPVSRNQPYYGRRLWLERAAENFRPRHAVQPFPALSLRPHGPADIQASTSAARLDRLDPQRRTHYRWTHPSEEHLHGAFTTAQPLSPQEIFPAAGCPGQLAYAFDAHGQVPLAEPFYWRGLWLQRHT